MHLQKLRNEALLRKKCDFASQVPSGKELHKCVEDILANSDWELLSSTFKCLVGLPERGSTQNEEMVHSDKVKTHLSRDKYHYETAYRFFQNIHQIIHTRDDRLCNFGVLGTIQQPTNQLQDLSTRRIILAALQFRQQVA